MVPLQDELFLVVLLTLSETLLGNLLLFHQLFVHSYSLCPQSFRWFCHLEG